MCGVHGAAGSRARPASAPGVFLSHSLQSSAPRAGFPPRRCGGEMKAMPYRINSQHLLGTNNPIIKHLENKKPFCLSLTSPPLARVTLGMTEPAGGAEPCSPPAPEAEHPPVTVLQSSTGSKGRPCPTVPPPTPQPCSAQSRPLLSPSPSPALAPAAQSHLQPVGIHTPRTSANRCRPHPWTQLTAQRAPPCPGEGGCGRTPVLLISASGSSRC